MPHTPGKLRVTFGAGGYETVLSRDAASAHPEELNIAYMVRRGGMNMDEAEDNARRLVLAWNCHDDLVAAVTRAKRDAENRLYRLPVDGPGVSEQKDILSAQIGSYNAVIAKAEGR